MSAELVVNATLKKNGFPVMIPRSIHLRLNEKKKTLERN